MQAEKIAHYEQHPVTPERKAELIAAGYRIFDLTYAPEGWVSDEEQAAKPAKESKRGKAKDQEGDE